MSVDDVAGLERILKRSIILRDVAGGDIYNSGKYRQSRWKTVLLICHNGHAWSKDRHPTKEGSPLLRGRYMAGDPGGDQ